MFNDRYNTLCQNTGSSVLEYTWFKYTLYVLIIIDCCVSGKTRSGILACLHMLTKVNTCSARTYQRLHTCSAST